MPIEAIVILILAVLGLVAGIVFMFLKSNFPHFKHYKEGNFSPVTARIWAETPEILALIDEHSVAKAAWAVQSAWKDLGMKDSDKVAATLREVGFLGTTDKTFPQYAFYQATAASAVQVWTKNKIYSKNIPLCVTHETSLKRREDAESAYSLHEYIHAAADKALGNADHDHKNLELWKALTDKAIEYYTRY